MRAALAATALALAGCQVAQSALLPAPRPGPDEGAWADARARFTRQAKLYDGLTMRAMATATYDAPELRAARADRVAEWKAMTAEERAALRASEEGAGAQWEEFTLALLTADPNDNDLDAPRSVWRIALAAGGSESLPVKVEQVRPDALLRTLYPHIGDFDLVYRLRFPKVEGEPLAARPFVLRLAGPRGKLEFAWDGYSSPRVSTVSLSQRSSDFGKSMR